MDLLKEGGVVREMGRETCSQTDGQRAIQKYNVDRNRHRDTWTGKWRRRKRKRERERE